MKYRSRSLLKKFLKFFVNKWEPIVNSLKGALAGNAIEEFLWNVHYVIKELPINEVRWISEIMSIL